MHSLNYVEKKQEISQLDLLLMVEMGFFSDLKNKRIKFNPRPFSNPIPLDNKKQEVIKEKIVDLNLEITKKIDELLQSREKESISKEARPFTHTSINPSLLNNIEIREQIFKTPQIPMIKTEIQPNTVFGEMGGRDEFIEIEESTITTPESVQQEQEIHSWMVDDQVKQTRKTFWGLGKIRVKAKENAPAKKDVKPTKTKDINGVTKTKLELERTKKEIEEREMALKVAIELEKQKEQELKSKEAEKRKHEKLKEIEKKKRLKMQKIKERELQKAEKLRQKELLKQEKLKEALEKKALLEKRKLEKQKEQELKAKEAEKIKLEKQKEAELKAKEAEREKQEKLKELQIKKKQEEREKLKKIKTEKPKKKGKFTLFKIDRKKKEKKKETKQDEVIPIVDTGAIPKEEHIPWDEDVEKLIPIIDNLLEKLPEDVIDNFANSDDFNLYEKVVSKYKK